MATSLPELADAGDSISSKSIPASKVRFKNSALRMLLRLGESSRGGSLWSTVLVNKSPANPALRLNAMFSGIFNSSYV